ncbi:MAG: M14 family zinc carboxypeptidase [Phycisphaerae bacterium]|nr:M14 family zinc carboxypeptidase [Phycisphaerae bacterium]
MFLTLAASTAHLHGAPPGQQQYQQYQQYQGDQVIRVIPADLKQLRTTLAMADDVWSHGASVGKPLDVLVDAESLTSLRRAGVPFTVLIDDVGGLVAAEKARLAAQGGIAGGADWFDDFKTYAQINAKLDELAAQRPDICSVVEAGLSLEGRPIRGLRISSAAAGAPAILFNGCQHAREWVSPMTVMYIANRLVEDAATDQSIQMLLQQAEILVIPVVNPDGYQYSWDVDRFWRKNRRNNGNGTFGVDLNRNWAYEWGGEGASSNPSSETYRGPFPFSEPETQAMRDFYLARPNIISNIDFHSYGQLVLSPWGYTLAPAPQTLFMEAIGQEMVDAIFTVNSVQYTAGPVGTTLYLASGSSVDWAYGERGVFSYTIELRDTGTFGFVLPADQIIPTALENFQAALVLAQTSIQPVSIAFPEGTPSLIEPGSAQVPVVVTEILGTPLANGATLWWRDSAEESFSASSISQNGEVWSATLPAPVCGSTVEWYIEVATNLGTVVAPQDAPAMTFTTSVLELSVIVADDFETATGWTVGAPGDDAVSGHWVRVDPNGTTAQPEDDSTVDGTMCFVTGQGALGAPIGAADVDDGTTTLVSPIMDCSHPESRVQYDRWYSNNLGAAPNSDSMPVEISSDGGGTWTQLELVTENALAWVTKSFRVADFVPPTANVRLRFIASDLGSGSLVEAGVDGFRVVVLGCPQLFGDLNEDGTIDAADLAVLLGAWGAAGGPADLDGSGLVDAGDLAVLLGAWN